jgi:hypothetical protein
LPFHHVLKKLQGPRQPQTLVPPSWSTEPPELFQRIISVIDKLPSPRHLVIAPRRDCDDAHQELSFSFPSPFAYPQFGF